MGKHSAVLAGYSVVKGDYVINLDDDFQSPVYRLWDLLIPLERDECDVTTAEYLVKKESLFKKFGSNINLFVSEIMLDKPRGLRFENLSAMKRFVCDEVIKYQNPFPFLEGLIVRVTKRIKKIPMENRNRADNNASGFSLAKSISLFANGFTSFSVKPLRAATFSGVAVAVVGLLYALWTIINRIVNPMVPVGWSSTIAVVLVLGGVILVDLGMIGEYIGRIYISLNNSPQYVVKKLINVVQEERAKKQ